MELEKFIVTEETSIYDAASVIDRNGHQIVFVCREGKLVGALSDGDIRRHILRNGDFSLPVKEIANYSPKYVTSKNRFEADFFLRKFILSAIPVLNDEHEIVSIEFGDSERVIKHVQLDTPAVVMAGGKGSRLAPYTDILPKPLIPIGEKTITEHIIDRFASFGCNSVYMIINYKKELIKAYFRELPYVNDIRFVEETEFGGTGGGLKLLDGLIGQTFFMSNCDILVDADYEDILHFHKDKRYIITMVCAMKKISIPYGTVQLNKDGVPLKLIEKPEYSLLTNTGFYVIEPEFLRYIPRNTFIGITDIIQQLIEEGQRVGVYPVSENAWMDMGQLSELHKMRFCFEERYE